MNDTEECRNIMIKHRTYEGMIGYYEGYYDCFQQFASYLADDDSTFKACQKMNMIVNLIEKAVFHEVRTDCATCEGKDLCKYAFTGKQNCKAYEPHTERSE